MNGRTAVGLAILTTLLGNIIYTQAVAATRVYAFAMFSSVNPYQIHVSVGDTPLTPEEVQQRYGYRAAGVETRSIQHIKNVITAVESKATDRAHVSLTYATDGGPQQQWSPP